jgi:hypothetical protein
VSDSSPVTPPGSAAHAFRVLWDAMSDVMGPATTAALLRRAARRGAARAPGSPDLAALVIRREGFGYRYDIPAPWHDAALPLAPMCALVQELRPLLVELTGPVVLRRLVELPELVECGLTPIREEPEAT